MGYRAVGPSRVSPSSKRTFPYRPVEAPSMIKNEISIHIAKSWFGLYSGEFRGYSCLDLAWPLKRYARTPLRAYRKARRAAIKFNSEFANWDVKITWEDDI